MGPTIAILDISIWCLAVSVLFFAASAVDSKNNPADELVAVINANRTAHKSTALSDNAGLGCLALQYIKAYKGNCGEVSDKKPANSDFVDTFAPNCGILATTLSPITGRLLGCQSKYVQPAEAFNDILIRDAKGLEILNNKNHTQVGAAVSGTDGGSPYFWCVLFSGGKPNGTFTPEGGVLKLTRPGCFSGNDDDCSESTIIHHNLGLVALAILAGEAETLIHKLKRREIESSQMADGGFRSKVDRFLYSGEKKHVLAGFTIVGIVFGVPWYLRNRGRFHQSHQDYMEKADKARSERLSVK